jgi:hypothetical protein
MSEPYHSLYPFRRTSRYGTRIGPVSGKEKFQAGADWAAPAGTPISAATPGKVVCSGFNPGFGRRKLRICVRVTSAGLSIGLLIAALAQSAVAQTPPKGKSENGTSQSKVYSASVFSEISIDHKIGGVRWCYESDPAVIFGKDRLLLRADLKGNVVQLLEAPYSIANLSCSEDGKTISFTNPQDTQLSILDVGSNELMGYATSAPFDLMSPDGSIFALESEPMLVSGPDILRSRRVLRLISHDVHWTRELVFVRANPRDNQDKFRILRISDLSEIGIIEFPVDRAVVSIFECSGAYFLVYDQDQLGKYSIVEQINDPRLGGATKAKFVPIAPLRYGFCSIRFAGAVRESTNIRLLRGDTQMTIDLRKVKPFEGRNVSNVSKDGRFLLALKWSGKPGERIRDVIGFVVLRLEQ